MQLVGHYDSPFVRRVAISLTLLALPFTRNTMSVFADAAEMQRINPIVRIPSLVLDDGEVLIDSAAILDHIDETVGPGRALLPPRGPERRRAAAKRESRSSDGVSSPARCKTLPPALSTPTAPPSNRCAKLIIQ